MEMSLDEFSKFFGYEESFSRELLKKKMIRGANFNETKSLIEVENMRLKELLISRIEDLKLQRDSTQSTWIKLNKESSELELKNNILKSSIDDHHHVTQILQESCKKLQDQEIGLHSSLNLKNDQNQELRLEQDLLQIELEKLRKKRREINLFIKERVGKELIQNIRVDEDLKEYILKELVEDFYRSDILVRYHEEQKEDPIKILKEDFGGAEYDIISDLFKNPLQYIEVYSKFLQNSTKEFEDFCLDQGFTESERGKILNVFVLWKNKSVPFYIKDRRK